MSLVRFSVAVLACTAFAASASAQVNLYRGPSLYNNSLPYWYGPRVGPVIQTYDTHWIYRYFAPTPYAYGAVAPSGATPYGASGFAPWATSDRTRRLWQDLGYNWNPADPPRMRTALPPAIPAETPVPAERALAANVDKLKDPSRAILEFHVAIPDTIVTIKSGEDERRVDGGDVRVVATPKLRDAKAEYQLRVRAQFGEDVGPWTTLSFRAGQRIVLDVTPQGITPRKGGSL